jgi:L-2-hydroxycarboxylate dehydrogenase (NAD+)
MCPEPRTGGQWWEPTEDLIEVPLDGVETVGVTALRHAGAQHAGAKFLMSSMLSKAAQGDPIRGVGMLPNILHCANDGTAVLDPEIAILKASAATALVDGGRNANGGIVCHAAMTLAISKAQTQGVSWVSCTNSHWNLGPLLKMATQEGLIAIILNSSMPTVAPIGGTVPLLGNAPTGIGIPAGENPPVIVDLSMTNTASSPVALAATIPGSTIPLDFIIDARGNPTTDPRDYLDERNVKVGATHLDLRGSLVPLGGALSGHKGYALLFAINVLATALSDTDAPWSTSEEGNAQQGSQIIVADPGTFTSMSVFTGRVDEFIDAARNSPKRRDVEEILYPGEKSQRLQKNRRDIGSILMPRSHLEILRALARDQDMDETILFVEGP